MVLPKKQRLGAKSAEKFYYNKIIEVKTLLSVKNKNCWIKFINSAVKIKHYFNIIYCNKIYCPSYWLLNDHHEDVLPYLWQCSACRPKKQRLGAKSAEKFYYNKIIEVKTLLSVKK
jgi:hypothetical protein